MCAELLADYERNRFRVELAAEAHDLLDQPEPEEPTDDKLMDIARATDLVYYMGKGCGFASPYMEETDITAEVLAFARAVLAKWGNSQGILDSSRQSAPEGAHFTDSDYNREIHYAWELEDAEGEWQAGGSANRLDDVRREGSHYLQTYSQDGPHKLIIQRHCLSTVEEVTND